MCCSVRAGYSPCECSRGDPNQNGPRPSTTATSIMFWIPLRGSRCPTPVSPSLFLVHCGCRYQWGRGCLCPLLLLLPPCGVPASAFPPFLYSPAFVEGSGSWRATSFRVSCVVHHLMRQPNQPATFVFNRVVLCCSSTNMEQIATGLISTRAYKGRGR